MSVNKNLLNKTSQTILSKRGVKKNIEPYKIFGTEGWREEAALIQPSGNGLPREAPVVSTVKKIGDWGT